ncbi:MAG: DUF2442 domain-containing protein [Anaerolineae bacterium]|nr:DUF2442 domain-containing protein [Anaerolineae bacterium]
MAEAAIEVVRPVSVAFRDDMIWITLADRRVIGAPLARYPWLQAATDEQRSDYRIGAFSILWETLKDGIDIEGLLSSAPLMSDDLKLKR